MTQKTVREKIEEIIYYIGYDRTTKKAISQILKVIVESLPQSKMFNKTTNLSYYEGYNDAMSDVKERLLLGMLNRMS